VDSVWHSACQCTLGAVIETATDYNRPGKAPRGLLSTGRENYHENQSVLNAATLGLVIAKPMWAQEHNPDPALIGQLEQKLAESDAEAKSLKGGPMEIWLLRKAEIEKVIDRLNAGKAVDSKEVDKILSGHVNY
jgi:hypothetical protein